MKASRFVLAAATIWAATAALDANSVQAQQTPEADLQALLMYSKLAVEPDQYGVQTTPCDGDAAAQDTREVVQLPDSVINQIEGRLAGRDTGRDSSPSATRWPGDDDEPSLLVQCSTSNDVPGVALKVFATDEGPVIETDAVVKPEGGNDWKRLRLGDSPRTVVFPGTDLGDPRRVLANFQGAGCLLEAARVAVDGLCAAYDITERILDPNNTRRGPATLAGHSVGGAPVQYIAVRAANEPENGDEWNCPEIRGYAFASIGLTEDDGVDRQDVTARLTSYVSQCDVVTSFVSPSGEQAGRITIRTQSASHRIRKIQEDICECIRGSECIQPGANFIRNTSILRQCPKALLAKLRRKLLDE